MGAARDLGKGERRSHDPGRNRVLREIAGVGAGDGGGAGGVSRWEARLLLGFASARREAVVAARITARARAGAVDAVLDEVLGEGGERVGGEHARARLHHALVAGEDSGGHHGAAQDPHLGLVAHVGETLEEWMVLKGLNRLDGAGVRLEQGVGSVFRLRHERAPRRGRFRSGRGGRPVRRRGGRRRPREAPSPRSRRSGRRGSARRA